MEMGRLLLTEETKSGTSTKNATEQSIVNRSGKVGLGSREESKRGPLADEDLLESDRLDDFRGLNRRNPWLALLMLIVMFSLAGIPPTAGFFAKLMVLQAALDAGFVAVVVAAVILAVIGAFYYLRIVKLMYFDEVEEGVLTISAHGYRRSMKWVLTVNAIGLIAVTPWIGKVMDFIGRSLVGFGVS